MMNQQGRDEKGDNLWTVTKAQGITRHVCL